MADISKITTLDGITYDVKDKPSRETSLASIFFGKDGIPVLGEKTYTDVIGTANDNNGGGFFYLKVRPNYYTGNTTTVDSRELWHVKTRVIATVPNQSYYYTDTVFDIWGRENTYCLYTSSNQIYSTSYRPIYYNSVFFTNSTGYSNNCGHWIGFNLYNATNPTNASYKRTVTVQLLAYDNCEVELQNSLITPTNIPDRAAHTGWYSSTNTSYTNFDACSNGLKQTGDNNTTSISNLVRNGGSYIANSALYRYQLLFQIDENTLTPLNNVDNSTATTKTMLTDVEFNPFGYIYYYGTTTNIAAAGSIGAGSLFYAYYGIDLRYAFNCGTTLTAHKPFYLVVTPTTGGKCKIASSSPWTQTPPTTNDGKWYILLGRTYSTYQLTLHPDHPIYYHDGTSVKQIIKSNIIGDAATVNGHTVLKDVPSDAKFTDTTYTPASATPLMDGTAAVGTSAKYAREDHIHPTDTSRAASSHVHSADNLTTTGYLNTHPENAPTLVPFINNDIAFLLSRGGSAVVKYDGVEQTGTSIASAFDGSGSYWSINNTSITTIVVELTLHKTFTYTSIIYVDFGASSWRAKSITIEAKNESTTYPNDVWTQKYATTTNASGHVYVTTSHTPVGASNSGGGFNKLRFTFSSFNTSSSSGFRIAQIGICNYGSQGLRETYMSRGIDDRVYRNISPNTTNTYTLGTSSYKWSNVYTNGINGTTVPSSPKFTDTTYIASKSKLTTTTVPNVTSVGSAPTLGTAISADDITAWNAGSTPTLGTAISADDITAWTTNTPTAFTVTGEKLSITTGTAASLSYTARSIPNVTSVGSVPSLSYTSRSIPNVTSVGSAPTLGTAIKVATGGLSSTGEGMTVATDIIASA